MDYLRVDVPSINEQQCIAPIASLLESSSTSLLTEKTQATYQTVNGAWQAQIELTNNQQYNWVEFNPLNGTPGLGLRPDLSHRSDFVWTSLGLVPPGSSVAYAFNCAAATTQFEVYSTLGLKGTAGFLLSRVLQSVDPDLLPSTWPKWIPFLIGNVQLTQAFHSIESDIRDADLTAIPDDMYDIMTAFKRPIIGAVGAAGFNTTSLSKVLGSKAVLLVALTRDIAALTRTITEYAYDLVTGSSDGYVTVTLTVHS